MRRRPTIAALGLAVAWSLMPTPTSARVAATAPCVPVVVDDFYTIPTGESLVGNFTDNDTTCGFVIDVLAGFRHGTAGIGFDGSFGYESLGGFVGTDQLIYRIDDGADDFVGVVIVEVTPAAPPTTPTTATTPACVPDAVDDLYTVTSGDTLVGNVTDNDTTCGLGIDSVSAPSHGSGDGGPDGSFSYTPSPGFAGTDQFVYRLGDTTSTETAVVTIEVVLVAGPATTNSPATTGAPVIAPGVPSAPTSLVETDPLPGVLLPATR